MISLSIARIAYSGVAESCNVVVVDDYIGGKEEIESFDQRAQLKYG